MTKSARAPAANVPATVSHPSAFRAASNFVLFLSAAVVVCALLGRLAPFPEVHGVFPKWAWFEKHRDEFDVLFVGSSRFYHQIIPQQFDSAVAAKGGPAIRSFNFGYDGMWPPESFYLLRRLLELRPERLRWVVIDLMEIDTKVDERNDRTQRTSYWHDTRHTQLAFADILSARRPWGQKADQLWTHGALWFREMLNLGQGAGILNRRFAPPPPRKKPYSWEPFAGYEAGPETPMEPHVQAEFLTGVQVMKDRLKPAPVRPVFREALREMIADVRRAGAEPIFVIAPTINPLENFTDVPDGAPLWPFNDPREHPILYDPACHYDAWHLNPRGAEAFTQLLAVRFAEHARAVQ